MSDWISTCDYLADAETTRRRELVYGVVREPPAPFYNHQHLLTRLAVLLSAHVDERGLGEVCVAPVDVVLDARRALIAQPDLVFIAARRLDIVDEQIWGAPDLVVEVLSPGTARRDRTTKLGWYRKYGVREYWLVDPAAESIAVVRLLLRPIRRRVFQGRAVLRSSVLRELRLPVRAVFGEPAGAASAR